MKIDGLPTKNLKMVIFHSYVKLPEGKYVKMRLFVLRVYIMYTQRHPNMCIRFMYIIVIVILMLTSIDHHISSSIVTNPSNQH